jgi:hypothetical protein
MRTAKSCITAAGAKEDEPSVVKICGKEEVNVWFIRLLRHAG